MRVRIESRSTCLRELRPRRVLPSRGESASRRLRLHIRELVQEHAYCLRVHVPLDLANLVAAGLRRIAPVHDDELAALWDASRSGRRRPRAVTSPERRRSRSTRSVIAAMRKIAERKASTSAADHSPISCLVTCPAASYSPRAMP